jgi:hypothetical protein
MITSLEDGCVYNAQFPDGEKRWVRYDAENHKLRFPGGVVTTTEKDYIENTPVEDITIITRIGNIALR